MVDYLFVCLCLTARQNRFGYFVPFNDKKLLVVDGRRRKEREKVGFQSRTKGKIGGESADGQWKRV